MMQKCGAPLPLFGTLLNNYQISKPFRKYTFFTYLIKFCRKSVFLIKNKIFNEFIFRQKKSIIKKHFSQQTYL